MSAFVSCWHLIHQWVNILPSFLEHCFILVAAKPQLSKNDVEMLVNPFITLSLDYCNSPCVGLLNYVIYRMQLKGIRQPRSFLAFCHLSILEPSIQSSYRLPITFYIDCEVVLLTQMVPQRCGFILPVSWIFLSPNSDHF